MSTPTHYRLDELAARFKLELRGDGARMIAGVGTLATATSGQLSFLANSRYRTQLDGSHAGAIVLRADDAVHCAGACLIAADPYVAFAKIAALFDPTPAAVPGVHPSAVIAADARVDASASIGPHCVIEAGAIIDSGAVLGPHCVIGVDCAVGAQSRLVARVTLVTRVTLGKRVLVHPGAVIGADGFGLAFERDASDHGGWIKVPQLGGVRIGDDCEIGANTTIDRGAIEDTVLEEDVRLDNQIQIAHNVHIGAHTAMAGCAAVAGSAKIGRYCLIGGGAGILGHLNVADGVTITARALVTHSIHSAGEYSSGVPLQESRQWRRNAARFKHLDDLARRVQAIEKELESKESKS
jgi:UDP-3-O-[3-hydroxymyristoyl] glucosamine N-acyltransferase